jgi:RND family efflux transporter MFP subunit
VYRTWKQSRLPQAVWSLLLCVYPCSVLAEEFPVVDCVIGPFQIVDLAFAVPGVIERVMVERSDFVKKGQVVAELASGVERATVELARARARVEPEIDVWKITLDFDEKRKARIRSPYEKNVTSDENKDDADRDVELSTLKLQQARDLQTIRKHELERAEEQLKQKIIHSPIDGFVLKKLKMPGEYVEDQAIVRIAQLDPLNVEAIVPIELFGKIPVGMAAEVHPETLAAETRPARVTVVDRAGDAGSGTFGVRLEMPNPDYELPAGLKCDLRFLVDSVAAITQPSSPNRSADRQEPQPDQVHADSQPDIQDEQKSDLSSNEIAGQESALQVSADQPGAAMSNETVADTTSEPEVSSGLLIASVAEDDTDVSGVGTADSAIAYHPIHLERTSTRQEDETTTDPDSELPTSDSAEDVIEEMAEDIVEEASEEIVQDDVEVVDEHQALAVMDQAFRVGPISSKSELTRVVDLLVADGVSYQVVNETREKSRNYIVVTPVISAGEAIRALVDDMLKHGISDVRWVRNGEFEDRVSAGVFGKHRSAMLRKIKLSESGFETEVFARIEKVNVWWVDVQYSSSELDSLSEFQGRLGQPVSMVAIEEQD